jgi:hypothetical protein
VHRTDHVRFSSIARRFAFPHTGVRYARKRMQTNLYVSASKEDSSAFNFYNKNIYRGPSPTDGYMMPLFYLDESGSISPADAELFKSQVQSSHIRVHVPLRCSHAMLQVYGTQTVGLIIGITNVCVGGATLIIGLAMYYPPPLSSVFTT